ncbi:tyrosine-type recombinase/integrase [Nonomuraea muscovyensis]|uniref:Integrase/recombinase XerC n=1 Tax=Nonomuraea muscovyensis TaxID=1124761 RepID=A0A7X0EXC1_9ACTN|nr:tyrosine-type recombinase/integrase [Nonomuraea muscovyensis]MBB6347448.1 integrase/recombinase XerC [Nonomuraea muscovyensis]
MTSENPVHGGSQPPETTSENTNQTAPGSPPPRRGARPTALPAEFEEHLVTYAAALAEVPLAADTKRTYASRVRMYLAWLADPEAGRRFTGDPLTDRRARDWAVRDYRHYLLREADPKRSVRYSNNALSALDDFYVRLGLGKADINRDDLPKTAPKALDTHAQVRWLRAIEDWPRARDRLLALLPFYAGLRIGDAIALDVGDIRMSARKGVLTVYGKGGKVREVPIHPQLRKPIIDWLDERQSWKNATTSKALFLNRRGGRLSARAASAVFTAIGAAAGLEDGITAHIGRHTFVTQLIRGGEDLVTVAELAGHARLDTLRVYSQPTDDDKQAALRHLIVDR